MLLKSVLKEKEITATLLCKYRRVQIPTFPGIRTKGFLKNKISKIILRFGFVRLIYFSKSILFFFFTVIFVFTLEMAFVTIISIV